jgi:hypothetical protein
MLNEALGQYEAAALMAVHFSRPSKMARQGLLSAHCVTGDDRRRFSLFERRQCEDNWRDYVTNRPGRPRQGEDLRHEMLRLLRDPLRPQIEVSDAIGTKEAAAILGCYPTLVPRLAHKRHILGRRLISLRGGRSRSWIFSRQSCLENAKHYAALIKAGEFHGRPRGRFPCTPRSEWSYFLLRLLDSYRDAPLVTQEWQENGDLSSVRGPVQLSNTPNSPDTKRRDDLYFDNDDPYWYSHPFAISRHSLRTTAADGTRHSMPNTTRTYGPHAPAMRYG